MHTIIITTSMRDRNVCLGRKYTNNPLRIKCVYTVIVLYQVMHALIFFCLTMNVLSYDDMDVLEEPEALSSSHIILTAVYFVQTSYVILRT